MLPASELLERFTTVVRCETDIPDDVEMSDFVARKMGIRITPEFYLRVEISWDDFMSMWSLRFDPSGKLVDEFVLHQIKHPSEYAAKAISLSQGDDVVTVLDAALPRLSGYFGSDLIMQWEYHKPTFAGKEGDFYDTDWVSVGIV